MREAEKLNDAQQRRLYVSCQYIDGLLCDMEQVFHQAASLTSFPRYVIDLSPAEITRVEEHIGRIRRQLLLALAWQEMKPEQPEIPLTRVALTNLSFIDIAIEELGAKYLRGCGAVPEGALAGLGDATRGLRSAAYGMECYLHDVLAARTRAAKEG